MAMKVEAYVDDILQNLEPFNVGGLKSQLVTLEKMKLNKKEKHRLGYKKVCQVLGDLAIDKLVKLIEECWCGCTPWAANLLSLSLILLDHSLNNSAAVRRALCHRTVVYQCIHGILDDYDKNHTFFYESTSLRVMYKCILVGGVKEFEYLSQNCYILHLFDILSHIHKNNLVAVQSDSSRLPEIVLLCYKIFVSVLNSGHKKLCAMMNMYEGVKYSAVSCSIHDDITKVLQKSSEACPDDLGTAYDVISEYLMLMVEYKQGRLTQTSKTVTSLAREEMFGDYVVFCSYPDCRKQETSDGKLKHCANCMLARYCSATCQQTHWREDHKRQCVGAMATAPVQTHSDKQTPSGKQRKQKKKNKHRKE